VDFDSLPLNPRLEILYAASDEKTETDFRDLLIRVHIRGFFNLLSPSKRIILKRRLP
jgi:hypothetical protein